MLTIQTHTIFMNRSFGAVETDRQTDGSEISERPDRVSVPLTDSTFLSDLTQPHQLRDKLSLGLRSIWPLSPVNWRLNGP